MEEVGTKQTNNYSACNSIGYRFRRISPIRLELTQQATNLQLAGYQNPFRLTNHSPLYCWRGSGYEFRNEKLLEVDNHKINTATLIKNNEMLHTAWWYDNGIDKTGNNISWRWNTIKNQQACQMINVTCEDFSTLYMEVEHLNN